jgi:hypothetical protein
MMDCREACVGHRAMVRRPNFCCYDAKLFDESTRKWTVSYFTNYSRKGGECTKHSGDVHTCSYNKFGQKCTNRAKHGGMVFEHGLESHM